MMISTRNTMMKLMKYIFAKSEPQPAVSMTSPANPILTAENPVMIATISFSVYTLFFHNLFVIRTPSDDELTKDAVASRAALPGTLNSGLISGSSRAPTISRTP